MEKPNVIYILADDMGYGDFGKFNSLIHTPNLDRLVSTGCTLSNCYAASPVCAPARAAIMTGKYPQRVGAIDTLEARGLDRIKLSETTIADVFLGNGYRTGLVGKWHNGAIDPEYHPNRRGFEEFFGFRGGWNDYYDYHVERNGEPQACDGTYLTDLLSREAISFVERHKEEPFFLHLAYNSPHFPFEVSESYLDRYCKKGLPKDTAVIYGMIECMDEGIGRLLDTLERLHLREQTIVIFSSDNGPDLGHESGLPGMNRFNANLRGGKQLVYEGGIQVPAVISWPGKIPADTLSGELVHGTDWFATLMHLCHLEWDQPLALDGIDASDALFGGKLPERTLCWQWNRFTPEQKCNAAIRDGDLKFIHPPVDAFLHLPKEEVDRDVDIKRHPENYTTICTDAIPARSMPETPAEELYNLRLDKSETTNLVQKLPDHAATMKEKLYAWFSDVEKSRLS